MPCIPGYCVHQPSVSYRVLGSQDHNIVIMVRPLKKVPIHLQSSQNRIIIKNGTVVNHDKEENIDIFIEVSSNYIFILLHES